MTGRIGTNRYILKMLENRRRMTYTDLCYATTKSWLGIRMCLTKLVRNERLLFINGHYELNFGDKRNKEFA